MKEPIFCYQIDLPLHLPKNKCNWAFYVTYKVHLNIEFMPFDILLFLGKCVFHFSLISSFFLSNFRFPTEKGMTSWWNSNLFVEFTAFRNPLDHESIAVTQSLISHKKTKGMQISRKRKSNICFCKKQKKRLKTSYLGGNRSKPYMVMINNTYRTIKNVNTSSNDNSRMLYFLF